MTQLSTAKLMSAAMLASLMLTGSASVLSGRRGRE
jgi:hypothetical protein